MMGDTSAIIEYWLLLLSRISALGTLSFASYLKKAIRMAPSYPCLTNVEAVFH